MSKVFLSAFETDNRHPAFPQEKLNQLFTKYLSTVQCLIRNTSSKEEANAVLQEVNERVKKYAVGKNYIEYRKASVISEQQFSKGPLQLPELYKDLYSDHNGATAYQRMEMYYDEVSDYLNTVYAKRQLPDDIVHVTCTGFSSPSPVQDLISTKALKTGVSNCFYNDCYAAFPAIKMAAGILFNPLLKNQNSVDLVHTEMLSLHVDIRNITPENLVVMSLFGDGFVTYNASKYDASTNSKGLIVSKIKEHIIAGSAEHMQWKIDSHNFKITLTPFVPGFIHDAIEGFVNELIEDSSMSMNDWINNAIWAIHPGGPKILDLIQKKLGLTDQSMKYSWKILKEHGNMSSATIPHIWKAIIDDDKVPAGMPVISLAFGPGLTACGMLMEKR